MDGCVVACCHDATAYVLQFCDARGTALLPIRLHEKLFLKYRLVHVYVCSSVGGAAVFWDQRLPHSNSRYNRSEHARAVVYGGYLPRVAINQAYAEEQVGSTRTHLF